MDVHVLIREDQNEHGFIDTSVVGVFAQEGAALAAMETARQEAKAEGARIWGDEGDWDESDWEVSWMVERKHCADAVIAGAASTTVGAATLR